MRHNRDVTTLLFCTITILCSRAFADLHCDPVDLTKPLPCPTENHLCDGATKTCQCKPGFDKVNETFCLDLGQKTGQTQTPNRSSLVASSHDTSHHVIVGVVVPLVVLLLVIFGVYVGKKYQLVAWVRTKIQQRTRNYDEFMIGQDDDDPPLH